MSVSVVGLEALVVSGWGTGSLGGGGGGENGITKKQIYCLSERERERERETERQTERRGQQKRGKDATLDNDPMRNDSRVLI